MAKKTEEKKNFWQSWKYLIFGVVGAILLISSMSIQNVFLYYETEDQERYAVKMDYSAFGMCIRCDSVGDNAQAIVEKAIFIGNGKKKSVEKAAEGLLDVAGEESGIFYIKVSGLLSNSEKTTDELIGYMRAEGYAIEEISK